MIDNKSATMTSNSNKTAKMLRERSLIEPLIKNPFVHIVKLTLADKIKIGFNAVTLLPLRIISIVVLTIFSVSLAKIVTLGKSEQYLKEHPLTGWRKKSKYILRFCGRALAFCFGFHRIKKNGKRATREEATILVAAPHSSFMDTFVFFVLGLPSGVSRVENARIPFMGPLLKAIQPILVSREDSKNKLHVIEEIKKRAAPESDWPQLLVFPEGTTTNRSCLITFKPGAFIPGLPIQPVVVEYNNKLDTITWTWEGLNTFQCIFYTLCQFENKLEITYLPVYKPDDQEKIDAKLFARNVRSKIADHLGVLTTYHTYEDCRLMLKARELHLPFESGLIEFEKIKEKLNINYENCASILKKFTVYARKSDGKMSLSDFCSYLDLPASSAVQQVFNMYDRDQDGFIDFREFLIGLSLLSQPVNTEDTLRLAFSMFDKEEKGFISIDDFKSIMYSAFSMSANEAEILFKKVDAKNDGFITYDELKSYAEQKPEYAKIFLVYNEIKIMQNIVDYENIAESATSAANSTTTTSQQSSQSSNTLLKRPTSDKTKNNEAESKSEAVIQSTSKTSITKVE